MAIVREQYKDDFQNWVTSMETSFDSAVKAGSLLIAVFHAYDYTGPAGTIGIEDNQSNTWHAIYSGAYSGNDHLYVGYAYNVAGGSTTVTFDIDNGSDEFGATVVLVEVSGMATDSGVLDQSNTAQSTSSSWNSGNITTTEPDEYLINIAAQDSASTSSTHDSAFTLIFEQEDQSSHMPISVSERIVSSTLTESGSGTYGQSVLWRAVIVSFVAEGGVSVTPSPASAIGSKVDPTVVLGSLTITPTPATAIGSKVDPTVVLGSLTITPTAISAIGTVVDPVVVIGGEAGMIEDILRPKVVRQLVPSGLFNI